MNRRGFLYVLLTSASMCLTGFVNGQTNENIISDYNHIPLAGNAFITKGSGAQISRTNGLTDWTNQEAVTSVYFRVQEPGKIGLRLQASVGNGNPSRIKMTAMGQHKTVDLGETKEKLNQELQIEVKEPGYVRVDLQGLQKTGNTFGDISHLLVLQEKGKKELLYANDPEYYYWARRGPSCHINYSIPSNGDVSYYYNEITVPTGQDKVGSYFMANGFGEGYFGVQVNSESERRILFSVWSPFHTDDPNSIPDEQKIKLLKKGKEVHTGEFGNEGSGGQSYRKYQWKAGQTYKFLLKGVPDGKGNTDYTAWFFEPEQKAWSLIASFKRPKTNTYLKRFHSFLENFIPEQGYQGRQVQFKNQWVYDGQWKAVQSASFSVDNTYRAHQRVDAIGGLTTEGYFLQNGGFFNESVGPGTKFEFNTNSKAPNIDFDRLP